MTTNRFGWVDGVSTIQLAQQQYDIWYDQTKKRQASVGQAALRQDGEELQSNPS